MPGPDCIQAQYEYLESISKHFGQLAESNAEMSTRLRQKVEALMNGGWEGKGALAFFDEMGGEVLPACDRLTDALEQARTVTLQIQRILQAAEQEAARPFQDGREVELVTGGPAPEEIEPFPERTDFDGVSLSTGGPGVAPGAAEQSFIDQVLSLEFPWWLDLGLSFFAVGDIIDLVREQIIKRFTGQEPDGLVTALAAFGLAADAGWLNPLPSAEDAPNAILAGMKVVAKRLPAGETRDALAALVERAIKNPDDLGRLAKLTEAFSQHPHVLGQLMENPRAMLAALEGGGDVVNIISRHGDDAIRAAELLGEHAPPYLRYYDEMTHIPGAQNLLRDLSAGNSTTFGALGELYYFQSIKDEVAELGLKINGKKAADGILKDGTVVDVKNWNFESARYQNEAGLQQIFNHLDRQVNLRRAQYPGQPIRYVFTTPIEDVPPQIVQHLNKRGVDVRTIGPEAN